MTKLRTNEPISVSIEYELSMAVVLIDGIDCAIIDNVYDIEDLCCDAIVDWVNNTYFDSDYEDCHYVPCLLNKEHFLKG